MNTKMLSIKEELKSITKEIKSTKQEYKQYQKSGLAFRENLFDPDSENKKKVWRLWGLGDVVEKLSKDFRHKHIAYSLLKGNKYEQIEKSVRKGNEPDWNLIKGIQDEITS